MLVYVTLSPKATAVKCQTEAKKQCWFTLFTFFTFLLFVRLLSPWNWGFLNVFKLNIPAPVQKQLNFTVKPHIDDSPLMFSPSGFWLADVSFLVEVTLSPLGLVRRHTRLHVDEIISQRNTVCVHGTFFCTRGQTNTEQQVWQQLPGDRRQADWEHTCLFGMGVRGV